MHNLIYGLKKPNEKLYVEYIDTLGNAAEAAFTTDRKYAKEYFYLQVVNAARKSLLENNIGTEVIVLRERC